VHCAGDVVQRRMSHLLASADFPVHSFSYSRQHLLGPLSQPSSASLRGVATSSSPHLSFPHGARALFTPVTSVQGAFSAANLQAANEAAKRTLERVHLDGAAAATDRICALSGHAPPVMPMNSPVLCSALMQLPTATVDQLQATALHSVNDELALRMAAQCHPYVASLERLQNERALCLLIDAAADAAGSACPTLRALWFCSLHSIVHKSRT
jgi:hypothetical protein